MTTRTFGQPIPRNEDPRLLTGRALFVDDVELPGMLHAAFVRSPHAHARIRAIDVSAALRCEGVLAAYTAQDLGEYWKPGPLLVPPPPIEGAVFNERTQVPLAKDKVRHAGEPVVLVIAESRYLAEDAAALVTVDYAPLPVVADCRAALAPGAPTAHEGAKDNIAAVISLGYGDCDAAFAAAPHAFATSLWQHRGVSHPMEGRAVLAHSDPVQNVLILWDSTQVPHTTHGVIARLVGRPESRVRVVAPDVGGGFGPKIVTYPEEGAIAAAAALLGRPVKWIEDRREHFVATAQERDQYWELEIAVGGDGRLIGVRGTAVHDHGAYSARGINVPYNSAMTLPGPYLVPNFALEITLAFTNKVPVSSLRGAGFPQGTFAMERLMDLAADGIGMDRAEFRLRNLIPAEHIPYELPLRNRQGVGIVYDSGDFPAGQRTAMAASGYDGFAARQARARDGGRYLGIGLANYVKGTGLGPFEAATVRVGSSGTVFVLTGATDQGQGTRMMLAQICAETLGVPMSDIAVTAGDTAAIPHGLGAYASRQTVLAGSAVRQAAERVRDKALRVAAQLLEAAEPDLDLVEGRIHIKGVPEPSLTLAEAAQAVAGAPGVLLPAGMDPGLEASICFRAEAMTYSSGTHVAEVAVDIETGGVEILRYVVIDDCGRRINPMLVEGQLAGGVVHGIGNALFEWMGYGEDAQPLTTNLAEYLLPTAPELPRIEIHDRESPSPLNPIGAKGVGEGGTVPAAAAVIAAVEDALRPFGVRIREVPLTPARIVALIAEALPQQP